ncbi:hypothetical protein NEOLEDRAFT_1184539 [Neolentinus lepideus HHB14362 ss-1]|uniref:Uncharacterized protein n=1 Tax=Neolentinus lepideus HHB14362 ss-1 TaxID=1314782 RepID=A0A165MC78_9AGAM|nr:hypothetical protein NEOLEDRAFT_1184539 [Neolentinus lepideus HHB14362 ss-1]
MNDPPDLVNAALGAARALTFTTARRALSRPSGAATTPTPAPPALATAPNQHAPNDQTPPHPNTSAGPTTAQPTTQLPLTATTNTTYAMVVAGEPPPAPPPTMPPPLPTTANYGPPAQVEHDHEMAAQEEQTERTPIPVQPVHQPAPILAPPLVPAPIEDGQHNLTNPQLEAFLHFVEEDLLAIDTHTAPQDAYRRGSLAAFTTPPPGGFPRTHRTSNTVLVRNIAPTQLVTIFGQPNPVLIVLPHNWSGRDLLTRGAEAAAHIRTVAIEFSRAVSAIDPEVITITTPIPVQAASPDVPNPPVFFLRNLPPVTFNSMLERGVISHPRASFQVFPIPAPEPVHSVICAINGFTSDDTDALLTAIIDILHIPTTHATICDVLQRYFNWPQDQLDDLANTFARSVTLTRIPLHAPSGIPIPQYIMLGDQPNSISNAVWYQLHEALFQQVYETPLHGTGQPTRFGSCSLCHCITHPRGLCPFSTIHGWNGPTYDSSWLTQDEPNVTHFAQQARGREQERGRGANQSRGRGQNGQRGQGRGGRRGLGQQQPPPPPPPVAPAP